MKTYKKLIALIIVLTISINTIIVLPNSIWAKQEYRIAFFNELSSKISSLYHREALVGLHIIKEIYGEDELLHNIKLELDKDEKAKNYLYEKGFTIDKIKQIIEFINNVFPNASEFSSENDETNMNLIGNMMKSIFVDKENVIDYYLYDEDIRQLGKDLYFIMPKEFKHTLDLYSDDEDEKADFLVKLLAKFMHSGHGEGFYDKDTKEFIDLELKLKDELIDDFNKNNNFKISNKSRQSINIMLKALENTIKQKDLQGVYSDICSVTNLIDTSLIQRSQNYSIRAISQEVNHYISRAEILEVIINIYGIELKKYEGEFSDVDKDYFYADYISTAKSIGLINGYKDNTFRPKEKISRSEMAVILNNLSDKYLEESFTKEEDIDKALYGFEDKESIESWAKVHISKLIALEVINGKTDNEFDPKGNITVDEASEAIYKLYLVLNN